MSTGLVVTLLDSSTDSAFGATDNSQWSLFTLTSTLCTDIRALLLDVLFANRDDPR